MPLTRSPGEDGQIPIPAGEKSDTPSIGGPGGQQVHAARSKAPGVAPVRVHHIELRVPDGA